MTSPFDSSTDPRVQEALSRKYSNDVVILLPLKDRSMAVFNSARELCGIVAAGWPFEDQVAATFDLWHPPTTIEPAPMPKATLDDLELL